jgi:hypothetical protein
MFRVALEPTAIKTSGTATVNPATLKSLQQPTFTQVFMSNPVEAVKLAFTKYTPVSVTSVTVLACLVALAVTLAVVYGQPSHKTVVDSNSVNSLSDPKSSHPGTNSSGTSQDFAWKDFAGGLFTKYLGWTVTAILVVVVLIGGIGFGGYKFHQHRTSVTLAPAHEEALNELVTRFITCFYHIYILDILICYLIYMEYNTILDKPMFKSDNSFIFDHNKFMLYIRRTVRLNWGSQKLSLHMLNFHVDEDKEIYVDNAQKESEKDEGVKFELLVELNKVRNDRLDKFRPFLVTMCKSTNEENGVEVVTMNPLKLREYLASRPNDDARELALSSLRENIDFFERKCKEKEAPESKE